MKKLSIWHLIIILSFVLNTGVLASTISGNISYSGASTGRVLVIVFTDTTFRMNPAAYIELDAPGSFTIPEISDGTYYLAAIMSGSFDNILLTDPWGVYGTPEIISPVVISGSTNVTGINITLVDGTEENPNPFYRAYISPKQITQLPEVTKAGSSPCLVYDGSAMFLYKHDYQDAASAHIYKMNPYTGEVTATYLLALESSPNRISWINRMTIHNGVIWASGGYGDPSGAGGKNGIFRIDIETSNSSNQMPAGSGINPDNEFGGLASDGVNMYAGIVLMNDLNTPGIVKFSTGLVSQVPSFPFFPLDKKPEYLCYGNGYLWAGLDSVLKIDPETGAILASYNFPRKSAQVFLDNMFWMYDETDNTLKAFDAEITDVTTEGEMKIPSGVFLQQNYPNPFNPSTTISFGLSAHSYVSLRIFDAIGREVAVLVSKDLPAGYHAVQWDAANMPSGIYLYRLHAGSSVESKKLLLLR